MEAESQPQQQGRGLLKQGLAEGPVQDMTSAQAGKSRGTAVAAIRGEAALQQGLKGHHPTMHMQ